jgi:hypothetical protein
VPETYLEKQAAQGTDKPFVSMAARWFADTAASGLGQGEPGLPLLGVEPARILRGFNEDRIT